MAGLKPFFKKCVVGVLLSAPMAAVAMGPTAEPMCAQVICLSPRDGTPAPAECIPIRMVYFNIRIFNPYYNASATAQARRAYISMCSTARMQDIQDITDKYGELFTDPMVY